MSDARRWFPAALARGVKKDKPVMVVEVVSRAPYDDMLATVGGASLYTTAGSCTGSCLTIWPPLVLPKGKKIPTAVSGLGQARLRHHRPQVTDDGRRLCTFYADSGGDVTGNGVVASWWPRRPEPAPPSPHPSGRGG